MSVAEVLSPGNKEEYARKRGYIFRPLHVNGTYRFYSHLHQRFFAFFRNETPVSRELNYVCLSSHYKKEFLIT